MSENEACAKRQYKITSRDLPLSCPAQNMDIWNAHPRVYLPVEKEIVCPYCGTEYSLEENGLSEN